MQKSGKGAPDISLNVYRGVNSTPVHGWPLGAFLQYNILCLKAWSRGLFSSRHRWRKRRARSFPPHMRDGVPSTGHLSTAAPLPRGREQAESPKPRHTLHPSPARNETLSPCRDGGICYTPREGGGGSAPVLAPPHTFCIGIFLATLPRFPSLRAPGGGSLCAPAAPPFLCMA